jgi:hypothetical protein
LNKVSNASSTSALFLDSVDWLIGHNFPVRFATYACWALPEIPIFTGLVAGSGISAAVAQDVDRAGAREKDFVGSKPYFSGMARWSYDTSDTSSPWPRKAA